jgi:hypothetical protein
MQSHLGEWLRNGQRDLFFNLFEASQLGSVEGFDKIVWKLARGLGVAETLHSAGVRTTDSRAYRTWKKHQETTS